MKAIDKEYRSQEAWWKLKYPLSRSQLAHDSKRHEPVAEEGCSTSKQMAEDAEIAYHSSPIFQIPLPNPI
jgi:hypothetical protein